MQYYFEIYLLHDQLTPDQWSQLYKAIAQYSGFLKSFEVIMSFTDNMLRFFVASNRDLSSLSNGVDGLLLRPVPKEEVDLPAAHGKELFIQYVTGGNLLDLKEKYAVKKGKDLQYVNIKVRPLNSQKATVKMNMYFQGAGKTWSKGTKLMAFFPSQLLTVDFSTNTHYLRKTVPKYLNIEKSLHMLVSDNIDALFEIDTFPYFSHNYYLNLTSYEFDKHSFIIGASGSGKSKFISLFVDRLQRTSLKMNYRVIVIDPHASLADDFHHIPDSKVINFNSESTQLFGGASSDISAATELTTTLFKSLMGDQFNSKADRVLRFSLFVLFTAQNMSLDNLKRFISETDLRNQIIEHVKGYVPANIVQFFGADFNEMRTKYYNEALAPIISLVDEMQLQPVLVGEGELSLAKTIEENFLTVFSLNKVSMGDKVVKTVAGLLIQQIFLLAQARAFSQKVILIIDEVSVIQNPALASILAEARKFNLSVILTQQYFGQIEKDLQAAIFANVYNYYAFKVSEEDARALEGNLNIELPKELVEEEHKKGLKEEDVRVKIMTELHPRECLVRVVANGQVSPVVKARTMDAPNSVPSVNADPDKLKTYKQQAPAALPEKFQESAPSGVSQSVVEAEKPVDLEPTPSSGVTTPESGTTSAPLEPFAGGATPQPATGLFNLSELLAQHSSSREKIPQRKDKS